MFEGFSPETVDFLWGIRMNNNREWFMAHKNDYVKTLYEPMKKLGWELFQPFVDCPGEIYKVSRIYRDARMHHPLPYKESLWICIRQDVQWWAENPCLFLEINPEGIDYGFFILKMRSAAMKQFRQSIAARPDEFLSIVNQVETATGQQIEAVNYARPEKCDTPELERFFRWKEQIACTVHEDFSEATFGPELAARVREYFTKLAPLYHYFSRFHT